MEAFYMQLMLNARLAAIRAAKENHNGEYDKTHSPEAFLLTEDEWCNAATFPKGRKCE